MKGPTRTRDPLLRNGYALIVGSGATSVFGVLFWVLAAHKYPPAEIGRNSVAISTLAFIGAVAQLSLTSVLIRFIPRAGRQTRRLVVCSYAVSMVVAALLAAVFMAVVGHLEPRLDFLVRNRWLAASFIASAAVWTVYVIEDGVLTGLRRATVVPVENTTFSVLKVALLFPFAGVASGAGVFLAWIVATAATAVPTNLYLFGRAIPRHELQARAGDGVVFAQLRRYVVSDYLGSLFWFASTALLPLIILRRAGSAASAYFSLGWLVAYSCYLLSLNIGASLIVEAASDLTKLPAECRRVMLHLAKLVFPIVAVVEAFAPLILRLFGPSYDTQGATALRLLALSALPFVVVSTAECAYRALRRTRPLIVVNAGLFAVVIPLSWWLLPHYGVAGVGFAWLSAMVLDAACLLAVRATWLGTK